MDWETIIRKHYVEEGKTDTEIARMYGKCRTWCTHRRKYYGIKARVGTGEKGEILTLKELKKAGFDVMDMNLKDKLSPFDFLMDDRIRIEVKTAEKMVSGFYSFILTEKSSNQNVVSDSRMRLPNGRTKKIFSETCDYLIFLGMDKGNIDCFWVFPSNELRKDIQTLYLCPNGKYEKYLVGNDFSKFSFNEKKEIVMI